MYTRSHVQVLLNRRSRSTEGWNIWNVLLDSSGGSLSITQVLLDCAVLHDWQQIAGNPVKFGLGFQSIVFDVIFMVQHCVLYADTAAYQSAGLGASASSSGDRSALSIEHGDADAKDDTFTCEQ